MSQFIRKNIDIISSKTASNSHAEVSSNQNGHYKQDLEIDPLIDINYQNTLSPIPSEPLKNYNDPINSINSLKKKNVTMDIKHPESGSTCQTFESVFETLPHSNKRLAHSKSVPILRSEYDLQTEQAEEPITHSYVSLVDQCHNHETSSSRAARFMSSLPLYSKFWEWQKNWRNKSPVEDIERQPLLSHHPRSYSCPSPAPVPAPEPVHDNNNEDNNNTIYGYNRELVFKSLAITVGFMVTGILLSVGDSELLIKIIKAITCYLLGSNIASLFGENFCPSL